MQAPQFRGKVAAIGKAKQFIWPRQFEVPESTKKFLFANL
jgi:hypothetical protein